jgi:hypothetical protein
MTRKPTEVIDSLRKLVGPLRDSLRYRINGGQVRILHLHLPRNEPPTATDSRAYLAWLKVTFWPGAMARAAHPAAAAERTCQAPWYCHRLSGRHSGDPERPAA